MSALRIYSSLLGGVVVVTCAATYWLRSRRKSPEQRELERRSYLSSKGRITDGTLLDLHELARDGHPPLQLLMYAYEVAGVGYECSQDITNLQQYLDVHNCRIGLPASVKYDPHNPGNSIIVAEGWIGLRQ